MRVIKRDLPLMILGVDTLDDLWHLDKIIEPGDEASSRTERRHKTESGKSDRVKVTIQIRIESIEFQKFSNKLRLLGTIIGGKPQEYISMGTHHTIELSPGDSVVIRKVRWSRYQLQRIKEAVASTEKAKIIIAVMDIDSCNLAALREFGIEAKGTFRGSQGKQFAGDANQFYSEVAGALGNIEADSIVLAGPGFAKENFMKYLNEKFPALAKKTILEDIAGYGESGIQEALRKGAVQKVLENTRVARETAMIEEVLEAITLDKGAYGLKEVEEALDYGAADLLLVTDEAFSKHRDEVEKLLDKAEKTRCEYHIVSSEHEAGQKLDHVSGVVARLRFKMR